MPSPKAPRSYSSPSPDTPASPPSPKKLKTPEKNIPLAIILTLALSLAIYLFVGFVAVGSYGADRLAQTAIPLVSAAQTFSTPIGLLACLAMACSLQPATIATGLTLLLAGFAIRFLIQNTS